MLLSEAPSSDFVILFELRRLSDNTELNFAMLYIKIFDFKIAFHYGLREGNWGFEGIKN